MEKVITLNTPQEAISLFGNFDRNLKYIQKNFDVNIIARNSQLKLEGEEDEVNRAESLFNLMLGKVRENKPLTLAEIKAYVGKMGQGPYRKEETILPYSSVPDFKPHSEGQADYIEALQTFDINFCIGPAGTGKTYLAVIMATSALRQGLVQRIVLVRPAVEAGEKLGFLPGDFQQKVNPYLRPLYDALNDILGNEVVKRYMEKEVIEVIPLAYMRGRTLNRSYIILDEAQNTTTSQMKMFLTRMGEGSKIVVTGDVSQIDIPDGSRSGLITARKILKNIRGIQFTEMTHRDIVRHPLLERIIKAYEAKKL